MSSWISTRNSLALKHQHGHPQISRPPSRLSAKSGLRSHSLPFAKHTDHPKAPLRNNGRSSPPSEIGARNSPNQTRQNYPSNRPRGHGRCYGPAADRGEDRLRGWRRKIGRSTSSWVARSSMSESLEAFWVIMRKNVQRRGSGWNDDGGRSRNRLSRRRTRIRVTKKISYRHPRRRNRLRKHV